MMAPYNQYNNYYDPVGSNTAQPQGYTYQTSGATQPSYLSATTSHYQTPSYHNYSTTYGEQQYNTASPSFQSTASANRAAAAVLSNLGVQGYSQSTSLSRPPNPSNQYSDSTTPSRSDQTQTSYQQHSSRNHSEKAPLNAISDPSNSYGRFIPNDTSQGSVGSYDNAQDIYGTTSTNGSAQVYSNAQVSSNLNSQSYSTSQNKRSNPQDQVPPPRYNSPLHAIHMQQNRQSRSTHSPASSTHQSSPQMTNQGVQQATRHPRQQSMSVDPSPTTVDPSQVYDFRAEKQRKAEMEAERRKKAQAKEAARKAEEEARQAEQDRIEQARKKAEEEALQAEIARTAEEERARKAADDEEKKKAASERKKEQRRKVREEKRQSTTAASVLQQIASGSANGNTALPGRDADEVLTDEESQMRAMFRKMREFNQRNPAMLAQLWEEERQAHVATPPSRVQASEVAPAPSASPQRAASGNPPPTPSAPRSSKSSGKNNAKTSTPAAASAETLINPQSQSRQVTDTTDKALSSAVSRNTPISESRPAIMPQQQAATTMWPPHKKGVLAEAASKWLSNLPANRAGGRKMSKDDILRVLDTNPSYAQLCESIERFGITFERSALARELLKVVPDGLKTQTVPRVAPSVPSDGPNAPQANGSSAFGLAARGPNDTPRSTGIAMSYQTPALAPLRDVVHGVNSLSDVLSTSAGPTTVQAVGPSHLNNNVTTVDATLTPSTPKEVKHEVEGNFQEPPRPPADKEEAARKRTFSDLVDLTKGDSDDEMPPRKIPQLSSSSRLDVSHDMQHNTLRGPISFQQFQQPSHQQRTPQGFLPNAPHVYPPIPPKSSSPALPPVSQNVIPPPKPKGPTAEQQQVERIRGKMLVEPLMRDRVARKSRYDSRTIARDVLLATGRHPDMRALNAHLNTMDKLLSTHGGAADGVGNKSDLSTIRWDIIDPESSTKSERLTRGSPGREDDIQDADDGDNGMTRRHSPYSKVTRPHFSHAPEGKFADRPKVRRGRPPKSATNASDFVSSPSRTPKSQGAMSSASTPIGYAAFRQVDDNGNIVKKKGRPVGWRKHIHSREAHGMPPATVQTEPKPHSSKMIPKQLPLQQPHYQVYRCKWAGCPSELHNLEVLKKHIVKVHGQANDHGLYECAWRGCPAAQSSAGTQTPGTLGPATFDGIETWMQHVDKQHLRNIAWELGDGPRGGTLSDQPSHHSDSEASYLSDARGKSVTPVIEPRPLGVREHSMVLGPGRPPKGSLSKDQRIATEELKQLEDMKRAEGLNMGTEGTRLANAKRRLGFLDDEDFADEVESSELGED